MSDRATSTNPITLQKHQITSNEITVRYVTCPSDTPTTRQPSSLVLHDSTNVNGPETFSSARALLSEAL